MQHLNNPRGLTLLEMIVVLFILSVIALSTVAFTENADGQFRYEETRTRLLEIRHAITGESRNVYAGSVRLSGYVVENGLLPSTLQNLLQKPPDFDDFGVQSPRFDPDPDPATGINNGGAGEVPLSGAGEILMKGHASHLHLPVGGGGYFDGWGNRGSTPTGPNYGWSVTTDATHFKSESLGADGVAGGGGYAQEMSDDVVQNDWTQALNGWQVVLTNRSGGNISVTLPEVLRVSLLVYVNDADAVNAYNWRRITSDPIPVAGGIIPEGESVTATFPDTTPDTRIPIGEHLLVVIRDLDGVPHTIDDAPYLNTDLSRATGRVAFFSMTTRPVVEMTLR